MPKMAKIVYRQMPPLGSYPKKSKPPGQKLGCKSPRVGANFWCKSSRVRWGMVIDEIDTCINDFMHGQRTTGKIQRNNYHHGSCGPSLTGKTMSVFLISTQRTHRNVKNRQVRRLFSSGRNDIFFCLLTPTFRQSIFKQKKMSLRAENSA